VPARHLPREAVFAAVMADRADWDRVTRRQRQLAVAAGAELRRQHPGRSHPPLRSAEPEPATGAQRDQLSLSVGETVSDMGEWIRELAEQRGKFADRLAGRQSIMVPAEDPDYDDLGPAFPVLTSAGRQAILQPFYRAGTSAVHRPFLR
jgi:hypothetical protein